MTEREIICCGARSWAKTIAWLQIIINCIGAAACLIFMLLLCILRKKGDFDVLPEIITLIFLNIAVIGVVFGVFLLMGTNQKNTKYIKYWMIHQAFCLMFCANFLLIGAVLAFWFFFFFIIPLLYTIYGIWIVRLFLAEIQPPSNEGSEQLGLAQGMRSCTEENRQPESAPPPPYNPKMTQQV